MLLAAPARAATIVAVEDATVGTHDIVGGPNGNNGATGYLAVIGAPGYFGEYYARTLLQFDLSAYQGQTILGNATLSMFLDDDHVNGAPSTVDVHLVTQDWSEGTVTWNTQPTFSAAAIASRPFDPPAEVGTWVSWTIAGSDLQSWINNPGTNHGLLLESEPGQAFDDLQFRSSEFGEGFGPTLTFSTDSQPVPEPSTVLLAASAGSVALVRLARRRS